VGHVESLDVKLQRNGPVHNKGKNIVFWLVYFIFVTLSIRFVCKLFPPDIRMEVEGGVGATAQPLRHILAVGQRGREGNNPKQQRPIRS
jgi:hypothetical protein